MPNFFRISELQERVLQLIHWIIVIIFGMAVLILRNSDPLLNPIIYTEDGAWIGMALTKGWPYVFVNAKEGYFVWGNLLLLWASVTSSELICDDSLSCLPQSIAFFSYAFFSSVATLAYFTTKEILPLPGRIILFGLLLLIPLGDSTNEIIGRLSNIGYFCVFISALLLFNRLNSKNYNWMIDILLFICAATNPVCIPLILLFLMLTYFIRQCQELKGWIRQNAILFTGTIIVALWIVRRSTDIQGAPITGSIQLENLTEVAIARSILYPFLFWVYHSLTNAYVIILVLLFLSFLILMWKLNSDKNAKLLAGLSIFAFLIFLAFTLVMRQSLTEQLSGYQTTFPDRYFMGLNVFILFVFMVLAGGLLKQHGRRRVMGKVTVGIIAILYVVNSPWILESRTPRMKIATGSMFREEICLSGLAANQHQNFPIVLPIYFQGWSMQIPSHYVAEAISRLDCTEIWNNFFITDVNWNQGIARNWAGFFVPNRPIYVTMFTVGSDLQVSEDQKRRIISQKSNGNYLNIYLDGAPLRVQSVVNLMSE